MRNVISLFFTLFFSNLYCQTVYTTFMNNERVTVTWNINKDSVYINKRPYKFTQNKSNNLKELKGTIRVWNPKMNIYENLLIIFTYSEIDKIELYRNGSKEVFSNLEGLKQ